MKLPIDVHVIWMKDMNTNWLLECLISLNKSPVHRYLVKGVQGDIGASRTEGFEKGNSKYVAFVDWDDIVIPEIFEKLYLECEENPDCSGAYSDEILIDEFNTTCMPGWSTNPSWYLENGLDISFHKIQGEYIHHISLLKREIVEKFLPCKTKRFPEPILLHECATRGKLIHVKEVGYKWRRHPNNTILTYTKEEIEEAKNIIKEIDNGK